MLVLLLAEMVVRVLQVPYQALLQRMLVAGAVAQEAVLLALVVLAGAALVLLVR
jgi:hypothetical protein